MRSLVRRAVSLLLCGWVGAAAAGDAPKLALILDDLGEQRVAGERALRLRLSFGEAQLVCVCRAVLQSECEHTRVVLVDEATSNVDNRTDRLIQALVGEVFAGKTVLTIAHRLETVIHTSDRLMLLDAGRLAEFDAPQALLADRKSQLHGMYSCERRAMTERET